MPRYGYGQFCPVAKAAEVLTERWTPLIVRELLMGSHRFNDLRRGVPLMSPSLLSERLKALERAGVVERRRPSAGAHGEYHLTAAGEELRPVIEMLGVWGQRWARTPGERRDLDPALLMWDIRRGSRGEELSNERLVVHFVFRDAKHSKRHWWLVAEGGRIDLCLTNPGHDEDLHVVTDVQTLTEVWMGDLAFGAAVRSGRLELEGPSALRRLLPRWLGVSSFAEVERPPRAS